MAKKTIGTAEVGAFRHRDSNGKVKIELVSAVNKPLTVEKHEETQTIFARRFKTTEEELFDIRPHQSYTKEFEPLQENLNTKDSKAQKLDYTDDSDDYDSDDDSNNGNGKKDLTPLQVLKNMVDNIWSDVRQIRNHNVAMWVVIVCAFLIGGLALGIAVMK